MKLLKVLRQQFGLNADAARRLVTDGQILVDDAVCFDDTTGLPAGSTVTYNEQTVQVQPVHLRIQENNPGGVSVACGEFWLIDTKRSPQATTDKERVTCRKCLKELATWPEAVEE